MKKIIALTLALLMLAGCGATTVKTGLGAITTGSASDDVSYTHLDVYKRQGLSGSSYEKPGYAMDHQICRF